MADPLSALADREVPADTNYFDPEASRSIIARYSNTRREREGVKELADSAMRLARVRDDQYEMERKRVAFDRADQDYEERQNAKLQRGNFLRSMTNAIDPKSPDYTKQVVDFKAGLPPELQEDEVINSILSSMNAEADDFRSRRNAEATRQGNYDFWQKKFEKGADFKFKHLKPEDYSNNRLEDGSPDFRALQTIENERARAYKRSDFDYKAKAVQEGRMKLADKLNLSKSARSLRDDLETYIEDPVAFPRHTDVLLSEFRKTNPNASEDMMMGAWADKLAQAKAWDKKPFERELIAAQSYDDPDEYVKLGGDKLTEKQKSYRQKMWQLAHKEDVFEEVAAPAAPAPVKAPASPLDRQFPGVETSTTPSKGEKPLTDAKVAADFLKRAGGDKAKAREMARADGYTF